MLSGLPKHSFLVWGAIFSRVLAWSVHILRTNTEIFAELLDFEKFPAERKLYPPT